MKTSEQRKRDNFVSDLQYGKKVVIGNQMIMMDSDGCNNFYSLSENGEFKFRFKNPHHALNFVIGVLPE